MLRRCLLQIVLVMAWAAPQAARGAEEFPLLMNKFGELCTMCEAMLFCAPGDVVAVGVADLSRPDIGPYTLYHFRTKTFWGQVATIGKYLAKWVSPIVREERPVAIHTVGPGGIGGPAHRVAEGTASLSLEPLLIEVDGWRIDRQSRAWQPDQGSPVGSCARLPLRETLGVLKEHAGEELQ